MNVNRRGFLSAICGAGAVAALPLASVAAPVLAPPVPAPPVAPPPALSPETSELERLALVTLDRVMKQVNIKPIVPPCERARLGSTFGITHPRPFRPYEVEPSLYNAGDITLVTLHRQACRGVRRPSPFHPPAAESMARVVDGLAAPIQHDFSRGCRGLVFGVLPDVSPYAVRDCKFARLRDASIRAVEAYDVMADQIIVRFDVLWGWQSVPRDVAVYCGGGNALLLV